MGFKQIREALVCACFIALLASISVYILFIGEQIDVSPTENRNMAKTEQLLSTAFVDGTFQDGLESVLTDQFIDRDNLVSTKKLIDFTIKESLKSKEFALAEEERALFDAKIDKMENGNRWRIGDSNYLMYYPITKNGEETVLNPVLARVEEMNALQEAFPDIQIYVYHPVQAHQLSIFDEANDIYCVGYEHLEKAKEAAKFPFEIMKVETLDEYKEKYFASDHHWNYLGAYQGYTDILKMVYPDEEPIAIKEKFCDPEPFYGTHASATGSILGGDEFCVYTFDFPKMTITDFYKKPVKKVQNANTFAEGSAKYRKGYKYSIAYSVYNQSTIFDTGNTEKENLLLIGDSYSQAVSQNIASHFNKTYYMTLNNRDPFDYYGFLETHDIDKVIFMYTIENYFYKGQSESYAIHAPR